MEIIIIAAMTEKRVIGKNNGLPWTLRADMAHFKALTAGWPCIMGRRTWESLPRRPLPGRLNVVISRTMGGIPEAEVFPTLQAAIGRCAGYQKIFICGGTSVYQEAMAAADTIELTLIHREYEGDAFFPEIDPACWTKTAVEDFDTHSFVRYTRTK
jgi:dihydrofolate reductase